MILGLIGFDFSSVAIELRGDAGTYFGLELGLGLGLGLGLNDFRISGLALRVGLEERGFGLGLAPMGLDYIYFGK